MEKIGYFRILPKELITEIHKYFFHYFTEKSLLEIDARDAHDDQNDWPNEYLEYYNFIVSVRHRKIDIPFATQLLLLKIFLESVNRQHEFLFIDRKNLNINQISINATADRGLNLATRGHLINKLSDFRVDLDYEDEQGNFLVFLYWHENDHPIYIYICNNLETEVLLYKLTKFYNDVVTKQIKDLY